MAWHVGDVTWEAGSWDSTQQGMRVQVTKEHGSPGPDAWSAVPPAGRLVRVDTSARRPLAGLRDEAVPGRAAGRSSNMHERMQSVGRKERTERRHPLLS